MSARKVLIRALKPTKSNPIRISPTATPAIEPVLLEPVLGSVVSGTVVMSGTVVLSTGTVVTEPVVVVSITVVVVSATVVVVSCAVVVVCSTVVVVDSGAVVVVTHVVYVRTPVPTGQVAPERSPVDALIPRNTARPTSVAIMYFNICLSYCICVRVYVPLRYSMPSSCTSATCSAQIGADT